MYFCTPTFDPYEGLAQTLQAAYAGTTMRVVPSAPKASAALASADGPATAVAALAA